MPTGMPHGNGGEALVIGGGPAGATVALILARAGWPVALLERKTFPRRKVCGEYVSGTNWPLLARLGLAEAFADQAGPPVTRVGLACGARLLEASLPRPSAPGEPPGGGPWKNHGESWGRALTRERLDTLLLQCAAEAGVEVLQPWTAEHLRREGAGFACRCRSLATNEARERYSTVVIAAHGSWEPGALPTQPERRDRRPGDLLAFKAHFRGAGLPDGLMPLVAFPGGYGGLVRSEADLVTLSACVRRDLLDGLDRAPAPASGAGGGAGAGAGDATSRQLGDLLMERILEDVPALRPFLAGASRAGAWLAAGPIRPGMRPPFHEGIFQVGNAAGEAHPVVAEGISMALQSAWLLARRLIEARDRLYTDEGRRETGRAYACDWRRAFAGRIRAAAAVAHWAMRPAGVEALLPLLARFPSLLTWGARLSGKAVQVVRPETAGAA